ncbi:MAG: hypothetical protein ACM3QW_03230 [Ignavibacteriales bacterium]
MAKKNAAFTGLAILLLIVGSVLWFRHSEVPAPPTGCDVFFYGEDGGIWGKNSVSHESGRILKPDGRWLWQKRLPRDYGEEWQVLASSAFYDELTPCPATDKLYVVSVWSKDGGDANAALIFEVNTDGSGMSVIAEHVAPYPPMDQFFNVPINGRYVYYHDDQDHLWKYDTLYHARIQIRQSAIAGQKWLPSK